MVHHNPLIPSILTACVITSLSATAIATNHDRLTRIVTVPIGAEITGLHITKSGDLFLNVQHPADTNPPPFNRATIGAIKGVDFNALPAQMAPLTRPTGAARGRVESALGSYQSIAVEGEAVGDAGERLGVIYTADGRRAIRQSNDPDFNAFVPIHSDGSRGYLFTAWEDTPGGMSRIHLKKGDNGAWEILTDGSGMIDFSSVKGTWTNCFGTLSPWGTPLSAEELYFDHTAEWNNIFSGESRRPTAMTQYLGHDANPYDYGYIVEITDPFNRAEPVKRFSMGRFSHENAVVMPDHRTVYMSDDGTDTVFFKFVADHAGDLSAGTLYAAKATQDVGVKDSASAGFNLSWIELSHGTDREIERWIDEYDHITTADYRAGENSYISDAEITAWAHGEAADNRVAFLESRKAARAKGATAEFRKMEGVVINYAGAANGAVPYLYMAMSSVDKGMSDDRGDIQVSKNKCGVVYRMKLDQNFNVRRMVPVVVGGHYNRANTPNACPTDSIANPDNLLVLNDGRILIGEDTNKHENNMLWIFNPK